MRARAAVKAPVVYGNERLAAEITAWLVEQPGEFMGFMDGVKAPGVYSNERLAAEIKAWLVEQPGEFMGFMDGVKAPVVVGNGQMRWGIFQKKHSANSLILKIQILTTRSLLTITQNSECAYINAV